MIPLGVILHKLRIGETDTKLGGTEIDVEFHDDDDDGLCMRKIESD